MKSFKEYVTMNEAATITLPKAKNDQEIHDRLKLLKDAGIEAQSGGRSAHTDINVSSKDVAKAKKLLGLNEKDLEDKESLDEAQNYTVKVELRDARKANDLARDSYRGLYKNDGSDVFVFKKESDKEDFENDLRDMKLGILEESGVNEALPKGFIAYNKMIVIGQALRKGAGELDKHVEKSVIRRFELDNSVSVSKLQGIEIEGYNFGLRDIQVAIKYATFKLDSGETETIKNITYQIPMI